MTYKPFTILTESGHRYHHLKRCILRIGGKILGRKIYGPMSVYHSLLRGLEEMKAQGMVLESNVLYNINPPTSQIHETVVVLMGVDTLQYALDLKKKSKIKTIIAGPAISVALDKDDIFFDPGVDTILVPSDRVKQYFCSLSPEKPERIQIRPSGVADMGKSKKSQQQLIIYKKTCPEELYTQVCNYLQLKGIAYTTLQYGKFQFEEYQSLLDSSLGVIYLQESESQGIALQEAWIKDIPSLVWDRGYRTYTGQKRWETQYISCPYLSPSCGITFTAENFPQQCDIFYKNIHSYSPRSYCQDVLSDLSSTKILLSLLS